MKIIKSIAIILLLCLATTGAMAVYNDFTYDPVAEFRKDMEKLKSDNDDLRDQKEEIEEKIAENSGIWSHKRCLLELELKRSKQDYDQGVIDECNQGDSPGKPEGSSKSLSAKELPKEEPQDKQ